jgi:hypothetical protein
MDEYLGVSFFCGGYPATLSSRCCEGLAVWGVSIFEEGTAPITRRESQGIKQLMAGRRHHRARRDADPPALSTLF